MNCPRCASSMTTETFQRQSTGVVEVDVCYPCNAIWFDSMESVRLAPEGVIALFRKIHDHRNDAHHAQAGRPECPRCSLPLEMTNDLCKGGRITYQRCPDRHGRLTTFFQFLREKQFVRALDLREINNLKLTVKQVRCSSCGAPIDLHRETACGFCRSPIAVLDADAVSKALQTLADRSEISRVARAATVEPKPARARRRGAVDLANMDLDDLLMEGIGMVLGLFAR